MSGFTDTTPGGPARKSLIHKGPAVGTLLDLLIRMQPGRPLLRRPARRWNLFQRAVLATLAAMALTACDAEVPSTSPFSPISTHHRSFP